MFLIPCSSVCCRLLKAFRAFPKILPKLNGLQGNKQNHSSVDTG